MDLQKKVQRVQKFRLIDDVFFEIFAKDVPACQEILRTILEDENLTVQEVVVQRSDNDDHLKRARFNASSITVRESQAGDRNNS